MVKQVNPKRATSFTLGLRGFYSKKDAYKDTI